MLKNKITEAEWQILMSQCKQQKVRFVTKTGWFWNLLGFFSGLLGNKKFNTGFITCFGTFFCFPEGWFKRSKGTASGCSVIAHELAYFYYSSISF